MSSEYVIKGELITSEVLDISSVNVGTCVNLAKCDSTNKIDKGDNGMNIFENGTGVRVVRNSERIESAARIGWTGKVVGYCSKDAVVEFDDGCIGYIYEGDLEAL